jgi:hypothetical protein
LCVDAVGGELEFGEHLLQELVAASFVAPSAAAWAAFGACVAAVGLNASIGLVILCISSFWFLIS